MYKQQIEDYFTLCKPKMLDDIFSLIRIKSDKEKPKDGKPFGDGPAASLAAVLNLAKNMGFITKNYDNFVGTVDINTKETQLDILSHLDTVPPGDDWTVTQPLDPMIKDGKLFGRGAADDKGPAIAALYALKAVKDLNIPLSKNVRLIFGTDEECGSSDIDYYYQKEKEAPMTFSPDASFPLINIEKGGLHSNFKATWPSDTTLPCILSVQGGNKGNVVPNVATAIIEGFSEEQAASYCTSAMKTTGLKFKTSMKENRVIIHVTGVSAHASTPEIGNNAVTGLIDLLISMPFAPSAGFQKLCAVHKLFPHGDWLGKASGIAMQDDISGELTMSLNIFEYAPEGLVGTFDCRAPLCATKHNLRDVLNANLLAEGFHLAEHEAYPVHYVPESSPFIKTLLKCYEQYSGQEGRCLAIGGATYVHNLKNGVAFGCSLPGTNNHMHGADEFAEVEELLLSAKIFTQVIIDLCQ